MCVIMLASKARPSEEMIERAWNHNKDGMGAGWRECNEVVYEKGIMNLEDAKKILADLPLPYVAHFRVASVGGVKQSLTHPFLVGPDARLDLKGRTKGAVLFHNGHWGAWNDRALEAAIHSNNRIPEGSDWSDSRAMAWMIHIYGPGLMELLTSQKGVLMTPKKFNIFTGNGWEKINDVWCSNDFFWRGRSQRSMGYTHKRMCSVGRCTKDAMYGKDICWECDKERKDRADAANKDANGEANSSGVGQSQSAVNIVQGGGTSGPLAGAFTIKQVEAFHAQGLISRSRLKKFRKAYDLSQNKGNRGARATRQLQNLSDEIAEKLMQKAGSRD